MALSGDERDNWIRGLNYLVASVKASTYQTAQERMLRKYFYSLEQPGREGTPLSKLVNLVHIKHNERKVYSFSGTIVVQDLKRFMQKVSLKMNTATLKEKFSKQDKDNTGEIGFDDFCSLLQDLLFSKWVVREVLGTSPTSISSADPFSTPSPTGSCITSSEFMAFLKEKQHQVINILV